MTLFFNIRYYHFLSSVLLFSIIQSLKKKSRSFFLHTDHILCPVSSLTFSTASKRLSSLDSTTVLFQNDSSLLRVIIVGFHFSTTLLVFKNPSLGDSSLNLTLWYFYFCIFLTLVTCFYFIDGIMPLLHRVNNSNVFSETAFVSPS